MMRCYFYSQSVLWKPYALLFSIDTLHCIEEYKVCVLCKRCTPTIISTYTCNLHRQSTKSKHNLDHNPAQINTNKLNPKSIS